MTAISFAMATIGCMLFITALSYLLSAEYFSQKNKKSSRKKLLIINLIISITFFFSYPDILSKEFAGILSQLTVMWFVLQLFLIILAIIVKVFRFIYEKSSDNPIDEGKRRFLRGIIWVPAISGVLYGGLYERRHIEFTDIDVDVSNFPRLNNLKIAHLTDVHLGTFFSLNHFEEILIQIIQKSPDILAITGDIFDDVSLNDEAIKILDKYSGYFPFGVYFCWGNHEYIRNINHLSEQLAKTNIKVLKNTSAKILSGDNPLYILAVDYLNGEKIPNATTLREKYITTALENVPDSAYKILLSHHSIFIDDAFNHNINLTLTGHTHGGQFALMGISLFPMFKYMMGKFEKNNCIGYVSRGAGSWFPYRIGCPPEITIFHFKTNR